MKTRMKRRPGAAPSRRSRERAGPAPGKDAIRDGSGAWSAGLWNDAHAAILGRIAGSMPQIDELMGDLTARLLGDAGMAGRTVFRGLANDEQRLKVLRALLEEAPGNIGEGDEFDAAMAAYAGARRRWRAFIHGLWYTHENGRTFLAAPGAADAATFLVAREVKTAELEAELGRVTALGTTLARLARAPVTGMAPKTATRTARSRRRAPEPGRAKRVAPQRTSGQRGKRLAALSMSTPRRSPVPPSDRGEDSPSPGQNST